MREQNYHEVRKVKIAGGERQLNGLEIYKGLMMALFKISIDSLSNAPFNGNGHFAPETKTHKIKMAKRSWDWVHRDYCDYPFSFNGVCEFLGYDCKKIKGMIYEKLEAEGTLRYFNGCK
jgi:hypothetical protein